MEKNRHFLKLSIFVIIGAILFSIIFFLSANLLTQEAFKGVFFVLALVATLFVIILISGFFATIRMITTNENKLFPLFIKLVLRLFMPLLLIVSSIFNYKKDELRRIFIKANNQYIMNKGKRYKSLDVLVMLPHCLQNSKCAHRICYALDNCRSCSGCDVGDIKDLCRKEGVNVEIVTGGTAARKIAKEYKPQFLIAVACERDLAAGILDVTGIPVYGILNQRPNGPCKDTIINIRELEETFNQFIEKGKIVDIES